MIVSTALPGNVSLLLTSKQIASRNLAESVTEGGDDGTGPLRRCRERLAPWIELGNLLPLPPSPHELDQSPNPLVTGLRIQEWSARCRAVPPGEFVRSFESSGLAHSPVITASVDLRSLRTNPREASRFLNLASEVASTLRTLAMASSPHVLKAAGNAPLLIERLYETPATSWAEIWVRNGAVRARWVDPFKDFLDALEGVEAARVRQCPVCRRFFFALRKDQKACSKRCNGVRRVRHWRANQAEYEYRRKLKTAGLTPQKRKGRTR